jgi:hypothetical protein
MDAYDEYDDYDAAEDGHYDLDQDILNSNYMDDIIGVTKQYVESFFHDKPMYCGGAVPRHLLLSPQRISNVINTSMGEGIDRAYGALEKTIDPEDLRRAEQSGCVTEDVKLVREVLDMLAHHKVPKCFAAGMMLMYLEFCEGVPVQGECP